MKKQDNYFLDLHKKWMKTGELPPYYGLCHSVEKHKHILELFKPTTEDVLVLMRENMSPIFWGGQTIILFCHYILNS